MKKIVIQALFIIAAMMVLTNCNKDNTKPENDYYIFPVGRPLSEASSVDTKIDDNEYPADFVFDSCGGYWLMIPKTELTDKEKLVITFTRRMEDLELFSQIVGDKQDWISPSYYIDSDNEAFVSKANELIQGLSSNIEKAKAIQRFVVSHLDFTNYHDSFLEKASKTYELGYGTCMNFSRLYVALCRAADIPARTIWGIVYGYNDDNIYDYHHQWAEILDETGYWHPMDLTYTTLFDLNDIRYLDLIYAAEENTIIKNRAIYNLMLEDLNYYHDYPVTLSGRLGFELVSDNRPDSMIVGYRYEHK